MMKKLLSTSLLAALLLFGTGAGVASAHPHHHARQIAYGAASHSFMAQRWGHRPRTRYLTRTERIGWRLYRVTYRITSFRGRSYSTIVSRIRLR